MIGHDASAILVLRYLEEMKKANDLVAATKSTSLDTYRATAPISALITIRT